MTNAELAVLGLVVEQPRHGYQIEQLIEQRGMRRWTDIGFSSIYFLLKKLEHGGFIEGRLEKTERGPARKVYHPTPAGQEAFRTAVIEALSMPQPRHRHLLLGLANIPAISQAEVLAALRQYSQCLNARREILKAHRESLHPQPYFVEAIFDYNLTMMQAELEWTERFLKQVQSQSQTEQEKTI